MRRGRGEAGMRRNSRAWPIPRGCSLAGQQGCTAQRKLRAGSAGRAHHKAARRARRPPAGVQLDRGARPRSGPAPPCSPVPYAMA